MEFKTIAGGKMVSDFDDSSIPSNCYPPNVFNLRNGKLKGVVSTSGGNTLSNWAAPSGVNKVLKSVKDHEDGLIYFLVYNDGNADAIVELDSATDQSTVIFLNNTDSATDILNFSATTEISSLKLVDGGDIDEYGNKISKVLVWTDTSTEIRYFNIGKSRRYKFAGNSTVVNSGGICTLSHPDIKQSDTLRYINIGGIWVPVKSSSAGSLVVNGSITDGTYTDVIWSYRDLVQFDETVLIKAPPLIPVQAAYQDDPTIPFNNLRGDLYQFIYSYVYDDNQQSAWSVTSKVQIPQSDLTTSDLTSLKDNSLLLTINTGARGVKGINVAFRRMINSPNNYYKLRYIDKHKLGLGDNTSYSLSFLNNESYVPVAVSEVSNLDQDYVPRTAGCVEYVNDGSLVFGDTMNGYNQEGVDMTTSIYTESLPTTTSNFGISLQQFASSLGGSISIGISGTVYPGDSVRIVTSGRHYGSGGYTDTPLQDDTLTCGSTETFHDFAHRVINDSLMYCINTTSITDGAYTITGNNTNTMSGTGNGLYINSITFTPSSHAAAISISAQSIKTGSAYKLGVVYGTHYGRKSPVQYSPGGYINTDDYYTLNNLFQGIQWQINSTPPSWAEWYAIVATKNLTHLNTYYGVSSKMTIDTTKPKLITVYIENMNQQYKANGVNFVNYNYAVNDRFRFLAKVGSTTTVYSSYYDTEILEDTTVTNGSTTERVLTIRLPDGFDTSGFTAGTGTVSTFNQSILFEAYSPKKLSEADDVFYHIGEVYPISNPGTASRAHMGPVQSQTSSQPAIGKISGIDCFMKPRLMPLVENDANPTPMTVEDFNSSDWYRSAYTSLGTPTIEDASYRQVRRKATLVHTDPFIPQTNINGLNRVYPGYSKDYDITMGAFMHLINKGAYIQAIHEFDSERIPINQSIVSLADGVMQLGLSSALLNDGVRYTGRYGIGSNSAAIIDTGFYTYAVDVNKGCFLRLGLDGWDDVSLEVGMSKWMKDNCSHYKSVSNSIRLGYDPYNKEVIIAFDNLAGQTQYTIAYSEKNNGFSTFYTYYPECMEFIGSKYYSFKNGKAWIHNETGVNSWYGQSYNTTIDVIFNGDYEYSKVARFIRLFSDSLVSVTNITSDTGCATSIPDNMFDIEVSTDYAMGLVKNSIDGVFYAPILMDMNSDGGIYDGLPMRGKTFTVSLSINNNNQYVSIKGIFLGYVKY
jgi:hypothetical protein